MNLYIDPLLVSNYHLSANSPCIDAGDFLLPYDPDGTIADIGAYYYDQSEPEVLVDAFFEVSPDSGVVPLTVTFTDASVIENTTISGLDWDFDGDGEWDGPKLAEKAIYRDGDYWLTPEMYVDYEKFYDFWLNITCLKNVSYNAVSLFDRKKSKSMLFLFYFEYL